MHPVTPLTDDDLNRILAYWEAATPPPTCLVMFGLGDGRDPVDVFRGLLSKHISETCYAIAQGSPEEVENTDEWMCTAVTGNGPTSLANAEFYMLCHTAIPRLVTEVQRLRLLLPDLPGGLPSEEA